MDQIWILSPYIYTSPIYPYNRHRIHSVIASVVIFNTYECGVCYHAVGPADISLFFNCFKVLLKIIVQVEDIIKGSAFSIDCVPVFELTGYPLSPSNSKIG